jgi:hypothetical protein
VFVGFSVGTSGVAVGAIVLVGLDDGVGVTVLANVAVGLEVAVIVGVGVSLGP